MSFLVFAITSFFCRQNYQFNLSHLYETKWAESNPPTFIKKICLALNLHCSAGTLVYFARFSSRMEQSNHIQQSVLICGVSILC
jgi:hypothetical protein